MNFYRLKVLVRNNHNRYDVEDFDIKKLDNLLEFNKDRKLRLMSFFNESHVSFDIYKIDQHFCIEIVDSNYNTWYRMLDKTTLISLFNTYRVGKKLANIVRFPAKNNFIKRVGYKISLSSCDQEIYVNEYAKTVINFLDKIDANNTMYIYSFKTNIRLSIYKENNLYIVENLEYFLELKKDELIDLLYSNSIFCAKAGAIYFDNCL